MVVATGSKTMTVIAGSAKMTLDLRLNHRKLKPVPDH
jgi:hypothetical protein